jgi:hypothetical protein
VARFRGEQGEIRKRERVLDPALTVKRFSVERLGRSLGCSGGVSPASAPHCSPLRLRGVVRRSGGGSSSFMTKFKLRW